MVIIQPLLIFAGLALSASAISSGPNSHNPQNTPKPPHRHPHKPPPPPLVQSKSLRNAMNITSMVEKSRTLERFAYSTPSRNRLIDTEGHNLTLKWIHDSIAKYPDYYTIKHQPFQMPQAENASLTINGERMEVFGINLAPPGNVTGRLVNAANLGCDSSDFPPEAKGAIVLAFRGLCQAAVKNALAGAAGAVGLLVYNNGAGDLDGYSLQRLSAPEGPYIPAGGISEADGLSLRDQLKEGVEFFAELLTVTRNITTYNIIVDTIAGDHDNVLHLCAHSDSVAAGPGINDNGSGIISLLEVAAKLTKFSIKNAVRFSWWAAEEEGLLGSSYYVSQLTPREIKKQRLVLDFDMMASPNFAYQIYDGDGSTYNMTGPAGSAEAEREFQHYFRDIARQNFTSIEFNGRSDYGPFLGVGIAAAGIATGAEAIKTLEEEEMFGGHAGLAFDPNYHSRYDNVYNLNVEAWEEMTKAIAHMTATYARSWDSFPKRSRSKREFKIKNGVTDKAAGRTWGV